MRTKHLGSIPLSILLLTSLITSLIPVTIFSVGAVEAASVTIETVGQWETLENAPEPVGQFNGHRIEAIGNYIYFWVANSTGFYRYNPSAGSWETLPSAPTSSSYGTGIVRAKDTAGNPAIYIIAGTTSANSQKWYRYTDAGGWSGMLSTSIPWTGSGAQTNCNKPANGSEFVWDGGDTIYYFPGSGYSYNRYDWYKYTISTNTWTYMGEFNTSGDPKNGPGNSACFVTHGGENYIFIQFGHTPSDDYKPAKFMRYQISTGSWWTPAQTGYGADDGADLVWDGGDNLYVFPGSYEEGGLINEYRFLAYSIPQNQWTSLPDFPSPKGQGNGSDDGGAAGIVGSYIYYLKGGDGNGSTLASNFYRYQMENAKPTAWATGPKGSTNNPSVTLTYTYTGPPTSVKLYYTKDGGTNWTLAGEDTSVDGTFAYNITSGDGTYGWNAVAIGGGSTETDPPAGGTPPEAASLILDRAPTLIAPANGFSENDNTPTFEWSSVSSPGGVTYQIQIDDNVDFISPVYFAVGLVENNHTLPGENALASGTYFWRVRAVDNVGNALNWSSIWTLFIIVGNRWTQTNWASGPTKPSLQVGTWNDAYDNFYDNDNVNWLDSVRLDNYLGSWVTDHVVISEFATRGSISAYDEFVELYNPTSSAIDIGGWIFEYWNGTDWVYYGYGTTVAIGTIPSDATIPAHGFYLWGNNRGYISPGSGPTPDWNTYGNGLSDGASGSPRGIRLKMPDNVTVIDTVVYEGDGNTSNPEAEGGLTAPNATTVAAPNSVERKAQSTSTASSMGPGGADEYSGNAYDSNNNYNDFIRRSSRNPQNSSSALENPVGILLSQFRSTGWFESSIYEAGGVADWKSISWIENKPSGTSIIVEARTGVDNNPYDGGWSGWYQHSNGAENSLMENGRYIQYRVELSTTDNLKTPKLSEITLIYELVPGIIRGVDVSISPSSQVGNNGATLIYTVTVTNTGNVSDTYTLDNTDDLGWTKSLSNTSLVVDAFSSDNTTTLSVTIPMGAAGGTIDNITVTANGTGVSDSASCTAQVTSCGVDVTIENALLEGYPSQVLEYTIDVHNSGNVVDNFSLSYIPDGWENITIVPLVLTDVMPSEHRQATMYVQVPDNAIECTYKEITVVAESQFCEATDNDTTQAHVTGGPVATYTYVSSYSAVKGTVTDFANQQSADDGGAYSTLAERSVAGGGDLNFTEGFEHGGATPPGWSFQNAWGIKTNRVRTGTYSAGVTGAAGSTNILISQSFDLTNKSNVHLTYYSYASSAASTSTLTVDATTNDGATWVPVHPAVLPGNGTWKMHTETSDLSSLAGQSNVKFRWTMVKAGATTSYCVIDDVTFTATGGGAGGNDMEIYENISGIPSADTQTLEMRYKLANTNDTFNFQVWDGSAWNTRGSTLDSTSWTDWSYTLLGSEVISGTVQVRFIDVNPSSTPQDNILKDYLRVKGETLLEHCGVDVTIENALLEGYPSQVLEYTIDVYNSGNVVDNFNLSYIPDGWPDITIVPLVLTDVMPSEHRQATMFVHVPDNAIGCTYKEITVVAESQFCGATDNDTAQAHVIATQAPVRGPILIVGNDNFIPEKGVNGGGSGTELDPYIIENWIISAENAHGIDIRNTTAYFVVRNCVVENGDIGWPTPSYYGIRLENVANGRIENNLSENNNYGIVLYANSRNNVVTNNDFENYAWYGVRLEWSHNNLISNNFFDIAKENTTSATWAIGLHEADSNDLENNTVENRGGIYLYNAENIKMRNNIHSTPSSGLAIEGDNGNLLHFIHDIDNSNLVNGKPVLYLIGHSNEVIGPSQEIGYLGLVNCDNILVEKLVFARRENNRNLSGILMANTQNSRVENCAFENNTYGIYITCGSNNNILTHNSVDNNAMGIDILFSSDNNIIEYNTITKNRGYGIFFYKHPVPSLSKPAGFNNTIRNNDITLNNRGIYIPDKSDNNRIYHNNIINNTLYQAYDNGSNYWDDGYPSGGNYWSDYTGVDENNGENQDIPGSDGIGDTPYIIPGDNNRDRYPLMSPIGIPWTGTAVFSLVNLYTVNVEKILDLNLGSKLVVKFYNYLDEYENENVIKTFSPTLQVKDNENARHPGIGGVDKGVKKVRLDLTTDNTENVISTIASYTVGRVDLEVRFSRIPSAWFLAPPPERTELETEFSRIPSAWFLAPS